MPQDGREAVSAGRQGTGGLCGAPAPLCESRPPRGRGEGDLAAAHSLAPLQGALRAHDSRAAAGRIHELHVALHHLPWEPGALHEQHYEELHLLSYPDPKTRPERLCISDYGRRQAAHAVA